MSLGPACTIVPFGYIVQGHPPSPCSRTSWASTSRGRSPRRSLRRDIAASMRLPAQLLRRLCRQVIVLPGAHRRGPGLPARRCPATPTGRWLETAGRDFPPDAHHQSLQGFRRLRGRNDRLHRLPHRRRGPPAEREVRLLPEPGRQPDQGDRADRWAVDLLPGPGPARHLAGHRRTKPHPPMGGGGRGKSDGTQARVTVPLQRLRRLPGAARRAVTSSVSIRKQTITSAASLDSHTRGVPAKHRCSRPPSRVRPVTTRTAPNSPE